MSTPSDLAAYIRASEALEYCLEHTPEHPCRPMLEKIWNARADQLKPTTIDHKPSTLEQFRQWWNGNFCKGHEQ